MQLRQAIPPEVYREKSRAMVQRLRELPEMKQARVVHMYWPMLDRKEPDLRPLWEYLHKEGKEIVVPVMDQKRPPRLRHVRLTSPEVLRPNAWGVWEPEEGEEIAPEAIDLIIAPALAIDRKGFRLGYGGGFYDAFLAQHPAPIVGAVFSSLLVDHLPHEAHDVPVDIIVTEHETIRPHRRTAKQEHA